MSRLLVSVLVLGVVLVAASCSDNVAPAPESDSSQFYSGGRIPVDDAVYMITGEVVGDVDSLTRVGAGASYRRYDTYATGSYWMEQTGKGFVRVKVMRTDKDVPEAQLEDVVILKTTDSKVRALLPGDIVTFKCRRQYEAVAAVRNNETFDANKVATWEIDYCRMFTPLVYNTSGQE